MEYDPDEVPAPGAVDASTEGQSSFFLPAGFRLCTFESEDDNTLLFSDGEFVRDLPIRAPKTITLATAHDLFQVPPPPPRRPPCATFPLPPGLFSDAPSPSPRCLCLLAVGYSLVLCGTLFISLLRACRAFWTSLLGA